MTTTKKTTKLRKLRMRAGLWHGQVGLHTVHARINVVKYDRKKRLWHAQWCGVAYLYNSNGLEVSISRANGKMCTSILPMQLTEYIGKVVE